MKNNNCGLSCREFGIQSFRNSGLNKEQKYLGLTLYSYLDLGSFRRDGKFDESTFIVCHELLLAEQSFASTLLRGFEASRVRDSKSSIFEFEVVFPIFSFVVFLLFHKICTT